MHYSLTQLKEFSKNFTEQLLKSSQGEKNSLLFAKNYLPQKSLAKNTDKFQVIMIGGSHLESAQAKIINNKVEFSNFTEKDINKLTSKDIFLNLIEEAIYPQTEVLSVNFAFPIAPILIEDKLDGVLLRGPKGHDFTGLIGQQVGLEIEKYIFQKRGQKIQVTLANDTVALGLATKEFDTFTWQNCTVGIVGTGTNFGVFKDEKTFINIESGNFDGFVQTESGKLIDLESSNTGSQFFEKEVGGNYLVEHFNIDAKLLGMDIEIENSKQLSEIAGDPSHPGQTTASDIFRRSAQLIACQINGIREYKFLLNQIQEGQKLNILMEGSLYWKGYEYSKNVDFYLQHLGLTEQDYQIYYLENMGLVGIARLALTGSN
jgi:hexokinase